MNEVAKALRVLTEVNRHLINKLDEAEEEKRKRAEVIAKNYLEMDIEFVMEVKKWTRERAIEKLQKHNYDIARGRYARMSTEHTENILAHYQHKKNREIIEMW